MDTLKKLFIISALIGAASVGCSPANIDLDTPTATNTKLTSPIPTYIQTASATNTELTSSFPRITPTPSATNTPIHSRELPTTSTRLVGHWGNLDGEINEAKQCFFGELNAEGIGEYFEVFEGNYFEGTYSIRSEDPSSTEVVILIENDANELVLPIIISEDGHSFSLLNSEGFAEYLYMDSKTKPDSLSPIERKYKYE